MQTYFNKKRALKRARFLLNVTDLTMPATWIYFADLLEVSKLLELDN
tara:strand:- start:7380 stop:7520 length:141 start_codon:yes stop_codon:yes gene_type:complete